MRGLPSVGPSTRSSPSTRPSMSTPPLTAATTPEFLESHRHFQSYFTDVLALLTHSNGHDRLFTEAVKRLQFRETPFVSLGYSRTSADGSGIGPGLARELGRTALEIVRAGIVDPVIFELAGLLQEGIGADRISDMTIRVIVADLLAYSERVANELGCPTASHPFGGRRYRLPCPAGQRRPAVLIPTELLRDLPTARGLERYRDHLRI